MTPEDHAIVGQLVSSTPDKTPQPALIANTVVGLVHTAALVLGFLGYSNAETKLDGTTQAIGAAVIGIVTISLYLGAGAWIRSKVVPNEKVVDRVNSQVQATLGQLGPVLQAVHANTKSLAGAVENLAYPARTTMVASGGGGYGAMTAPVGTPLPDGVSAEPDPNPDDGAGISDEPDPVPEPGQAPPGPAEVPPPNAPITASAAKNTAPAVTDPAAPAAGAGG